MFSRLKFIRAQHTSTTAAANMLLAGYGLSGPGLQKRSHDNKSRFYVSYEADRVVTIKINAFWNVTQCSLRTVFCLSNYIV